MHMNIYIKYFLQILCINAYTVLIPYCCLPWDLFNDVHSGFNDLVVNYSCIINFLISNSRRIVEIRNLLGIIENRQISSLEKDASCVLPFTAFRKNTQLGLLSGFAFLLRAFLRQQI